MIRGRYSKPAWRHRVGLSPWLPTATAGRYRRRNRQRFPVAIGTEPILRTISRRHAAVISDCGAPTTLCGSDAAYPADSKHDRAADLFLLIGLCIIAEFAAQGDEPAADASRPCCGLYACAGPLPTNPRPLSPPVAAHHTPMASDGSISAAPSCPWNTPIRTNVCSGTPAEPCLVQQPAIPPLRHRERGASRIDRGGIAGLRSAAANLFRLDFNALECNRLAGESQRRPHNQFDLVQPECPRPLPRR